MKTVLITGASAGIGKATAELLLTEGGYTVYTAARRVEQMQDLAAKGARPIKMDITHDDEIVAAVEQITRETGGVDVLVNNAGFGLNGAVEDIPIERARYQFEVNLFGLGRLTQLVLPYMREKRAGKIVNITSVGGKVYNPLGAWYIATKHALEGWSDCLRLEVRDFGIDVVIVEPGAIQTEFDDVMVGPLMEASGDTAYGPLTRQLAAALKHTFEHNASPPSVISNVIAKSIKAPKPKTRYAAGKLAGTMLFVRKYFGDRFFDRFVMKFIKKAA